ncbi:MAG: cyclic peptide export ABC transporter [Candidatus Magnetomorum sp.]|nr:cyclic peptide export ABC transporter [Candidatus Magnetomorum sp.]
MVKFLFYVDNQFDFRPIIALIMSVVAGISESILILIINNAAQEVIHNNTLQAVSMLPYFFISLIVLCFLKKLSLQLCLKLVEENLEIYRNRIANQLRHSSLLEMEQMDQGEIYTKLSIDTKKISRSSLSFIQIVQSFTTMFLIIIYMLRLSFLGGCLYIFFVAIGCLYYQLHYHFLVSTIDEMTGKETELFDEVGHIFDGFKELKLNTDKNEDFFHHYLAPLSKRVNRLRKRIGKQFVDIQSVRFVLFYIGLAAIILAFPEDYSVSIRFKIIVMSVFMNEPLSVFFLALPEIVASMVSIDRLNNLEKKISSRGQPSEYISTSKQPDPVAMNHLQLKSVQFTYKINNDEPGFRIGPVSLDIHSGETIFLVGGNGSGKSTLLKVLTGLYPVTAGEIYLNGTTVDIAKYQYLFSTVFSDCHLFDGMYGLKNIDEKKIDELLHLMGIEKQVKWQDHKFQYSGLSTGQKKRLALVYLMLEDAPIYILDEWAAEQEPFFKKNFYTRLLPLFKKSGKTIIVATHDTRYFDIADQLITMQDGKIVTKKRP